MKRKLKIQEIYQHGKSIKTNMSTLIFLMAMSTDREVDKFHKEFLTKGKIKNKQKHNTNKL